MSFGAFQAHQTRFGLPFVLESVRVDHSPDAHAAILTLRCISGALILIYSGDTRPCSNLVQAAARAAAVQASLPCPPGLTCLL